MERQPFFPNQSVIAWFDEQKRSLPWRENPTPYSVWISEVMLQQTRVSVVIDYFTRWMARFPTIESLAMAPLEEVIKMWEGLGYYSRARNLHAAAKQCMEKFAGQLPSNESQLATLQGIGPYTLAALLNFAFRKKKPLIDGNVLRVMSRFFALSESIDLTTTRSLIAEKMDDFLPNEKFWIVSEAIMEIGATICLKRPLCEKCPLQGECLAFNMGKQLTLPIRKARSQVIALTRYVAVIESQGKIALKKGERGKVMADLYEFPYAESSSQLSEIVMQEAPKRSLPKVIHHFTHYRVSLFPNLFEMKKKDPRWIWVDKDHLLELPFSSGHRRILEHYLENITH